MSNVEKLKKKAAEFEQKKQFDRALEVYLQIIGQTEGQEDGDVTVYNAEEIRIQQYGDTAIVAFRLVATTDKSGKKEIKNYLNTGTFLKRNGKWQAVGWQATAVPEKKAEPKPSPK